MSSCTNGRPRTGIRASLYPSEIQVVIFPVLHLLTYLVSTPDVDDKRNEAMEGVEADWLSIMQMRWCVCEI